MAVDPATMLASVTNSVSQQADYPAAVTLPLFFLPCLSLRPVLPLSLPLTLSPKPSFPGGVAEVRFIGGF